MQTTVFIKKRKKLKSALNISEYKFDTKFMCYVSAYFNKNQNTTVMGEFRLSPINFHATGSFIKKQYK